VYTQLLWSTLLAFLAFGEFPDSGSLVGMAVIVAAGLLALNWRHLRAAAASGRIKPTH
jgi:drug/metabolite transporter (DMT)-like permease